jgi:hypothetical protein
VQLFCGIYESGEIALLSKKSFTCTRPSFVNNCGVYGFMECFVECREQGVGEPENFCTQGVQNKA